ncbi:MAG: hypothetical protein QM733_04425 [Ilumatobacteraceae bacterium]
MPRPAARRGRSRGRTIGDAGRDGCPGAAAHWTVGAGKTTVAAEINDLLAERQIRNAAIDLDALAWQWPPDSRWNEALTFENLAALWPNYRRRGVTHLVLARVLEDRAELDSYRAALAVDDTTVCRLLAPEGTRSSRLIGRMPAGPSLDWHLARTLELDAALDDARVEDFTVANDDRAPRTVALDVVTRAGWLPAPPSVRRTSPR